jgi:hypothetical protein
LIDPVIDAPDRVCFGCRAISRKARASAGVVALLRSPALPFDRDVVEVLLRCQQQIVEAVDL